MANKTFPSDANQKKENAVNPKPAAAAPAAEKTVEGQPQKLVQVEYKKDNTHIIDLVHALAKGINHIPESIWEKAKTFPSVQHLMKGGHIVEIAAAKAKGKKPAEPEAAPAGEEITGA